MFNRIATFLSATVLAGQLLAGGFFLVLENPDASSEARNLHAVLTIKAAGCHNPETAKLTATAIGIVEGQRKEIPLTVKALSEPTMFAVIGSWPKEGKWVVRLQARNDAGQFTNTIVAAGPEGIDRSSQKAAMQPFSNSDVDSMLK